MMHFIMRVSYSFAFVTLLAVASTPCAHGAQKPPSFLFLLADDVGWADFSYNNGTTFTPNIDALARAKGTLLLQDFHSGGTICSPTRATILTGRNHFRDCVDSVYDCSDMTQCVPKFNFAPNKTFTVPMAVRAANNDYRSQFLGKWHLGSFYNDSEHYGGITSSPITHGFDEFNATVEVAPTATANCNCNPKWEGQCEYGHYNMSTHCAGSTGPGGNNCCFNYWWQDDTKPHGVTNLTNPTPPDDSLYLTSAFEDFLERRKGKPFYTHISFHNCHIPFVGTNVHRELCKAGVMCKPGNYSSAQLDYYACLLELDAAIGRVVTALKKHKYFDNTMLWLTSDNGPEGNCHPEGRCKPQWLETWPGSAGLLRGRKRDMWEGGHRVPGLVSWPRQVTQNRVSWWPTVTMDFLPTVMDVLGVDRPESQQGWGMDGRSILPLLMGEELADRGIGWMYLDTTKSAFRFGKWKYINNTESCNNADCKKPLLYNLQTDISEKHNIIDQHPDVREAIERNFTLWLKSVQTSRMLEQGCRPLTFNLPNTAT
eukprot:m.352374 g.352374  ORF g.352374 m.352374 type:complete len:540 (-) comp16501_c0_seq1:365-1984(-)